MTFTDLAPVVIIGAGKMGGALLEGWLARGLAGEAVTVVDPALPDARAKALRKKGVRVAAEAAELAGAAPATLLVAVKPQVMAKVLPGVAKIAGEQTLVVSIAAGITMKTLQQAFGREQQHAE